MIIEYRYKWQTVCKSFVKFLTICEVIDWWKRFDNYTLENDVEIDNIDEIRITIKDSPYVIWFQFVKNDSKTFDITLIVNDYPYAKLFKSEDFESFLKIFFKED